MQGSGKRRVRAAIALLLALVMLCLTFGGCRRDELTALYFAVPAGKGTTFDPQIVGAGATGIAVRNMFEGLVYLDEDGSVEPGAAVSWNVSADGLTYTFRLRQDARWHVTVTVEEEMGEKLDGFDRRVTAHDFVFALRRAVDPATGAPQARLLENIAGAEGIMKAGAPLTTLGVRATDDYTLVIRLARPQNDFLEVLTEPVCMPCPAAFFEITGGRYGKYIKYIVSNGPFFMTRFDIDEGYYRLFKSADYVGDHPAKTDVLWLYHRPDDQTLSQALADGEYSGALADESYVSRYPMKKGSSVTSADTLRCFILNAGGETSSNEALRKAFCAAAALNVMTDDAGRDPVNTVLPAAFSDYVTVGAYPADPAAAKRELKKALEELKADTATLSILCEPRFETAVRRLLQEYQKTLGIGLAVGVNVVEETDLKARVAAGNYDVAFYPVKAPYFGLAGYYEQFSANAPRSLTYLNDPAYDADVEALRYAPDGGRSRISALAASLISHAVLLPVWQENSVFLLGEGVSGVRLLPGNERLYFFDATQSR